MSTIIFRFRGGPMDGRSLEAGHSRSFATVQFGPVLPHWFSTNFGQQGKRFQVGPTTNGPKYPYEVVNRVDEDGQIMVTADYFDQSK